LKRDPQALDLKELDRIVKETVDAIERGKEQIFAIAESARAEYEHVRAELFEVKEEARRRIELVDALEKREQAARSRLADVSRSFREFSEDEIKEAYEAAREIQVELQVEREKEQQLRRRRDELERRFKSLATTVARADDLVTQVGVAMDFLGGKLRNLSHRCKDIEQKRQLGLSIIKAQEEERRRVAREIHDGPAQLLANVVLRLDLSQKMFSGDPEKMRNELNELKELVRQSLRDVRKIIFDLRPMALDDLGLVPALRAYLKGFEDRSGLQVITSFFGGERRLKPSLEVAVFRLIQEATNNAEKHAEAKKVWVKVEIQPEWVRSVVKDDGKGFDLDEVLESEDTSRFGLVSMRERVELLDGEMEVDTEPGRGTRIDITIPLHSGREVTPGVHNEGVGS